MGPPFVFCTRATKTSVRPCCICITMRVILEKARVVVSRNKRNGSSESVCLYLSFLPAYYSRCE